ncbi:tRNA dimethylallyltransferase [Arenimonas soli]|uniref:tRNA dimethylallyltransferase n=1 Tax=Arenimonas soli TaxID=2269504 RepID=A0ABQ1HDC1_9GAMM|nr:tRNA (adenosine(37)-N6)-dimethylallyltransferase MiaA [Arenimonas soli]GGA70504.1 tRNA dimethylallyltransferase [Arenimonas soli]
MRDTRPLAVALMGPTASGKTALAVDWCQRLDTEVISVDSALVYRGLDIGSAKPDAATLARAPHHLVDVRDPHEVFSAADFAREALPPMQALADRGRVPLLVGGTGLYFSALLHGLSELPEADPGIRAGIIAEAAEQGWPALHAQMAASDPAAGVRIKPGDSQRITRALEVWRLTGRPISDWQQAGERRRFPFRVLRLVLAPADRTVLHARIEQRFDQMLGQGFLDEVRRLRADPRLHPDLPSMRAVGYRQAWAYLEGRIDAPTFREQAIAATRQLAKRQLTWLRARTEALWVDPQAERALADQRLAAFLARPAGR